MGVSVVLAWAATGQCCDENGVRYTGSSAGSRDFADLDDARKFCEDVLERCPFVECHIRGDESETLGSDTFVGQPFTIPASGTFQVRLFEWLSKALVSEVGAYLAASDEEPPLQFATFRDASRYCKSIMKSVRTIEPWIYGPDGKVMQRGGTNVTLHESGEHTVQLPWWRSLARDWLGLDTRER